MAYAKKTAKNEAYQKLKTDLKEGNPLGNAYLFYGEESYLREYYLGEIRKRLIPAGFEEFNYHALEGKDLTAQSLTEMAEAMPMMAERTLIVVTDWDIYKLNEDQRERFIALLEDLPEYCCIVFVYDTVAYKQNKTGGVSDFPLRRADDRAFSGDRQDWGLRQGGSHHPAGH